ncbi:uncharacterized protein ELE39_001041 [Cryptosporidium sp. chipmunk genotype I]|uniref:uncharacterized protein n=1 Tax=Cryptosporidium sp. chipmunk genotype I TaxID=1280935 RepID=UPI00351A71D5|nr:hypothetical protein ELE39_001041 [Cryptosporidium sp. chipmunk genotype I]
MNFESEIVQITSRVLRESNSNRPKTSSEPHQKIDEKVIQAIGMIVEECIDSSLQAGVHRMLTRDSSEVKAEDISNYVKTNYGISKKLIDK